MASLSALRGLVKSLKGGVSLVPDPDNPHAQRFEGKEAAAFLAGLVRRRDKTQQSKPYHHLNEQERMVEDIYQEKAMEEAIETGQQLLDQGFIRSVGGDFPFKASHVYYEFAVDKGDESRPERQFSSFSSFARKHWTMNSVLSDPNVLAIFEAFAAKTEHADKMKFWRAVENFKSKHSTPLDDTDVALLHSDAVTLYERFLAPNRAVLRLSSDEMNAITTELRQPRPIYARVHHVFDRAQTVAEEIMQQTLLKDFLTSLGIAQGPESASSEDSSDAHDDDRRRNDEEIKSPSSASDSETSESGKSRRKRQKACMEVLSSERSYVAALQKVIDVYLRPLAKMTIMKGAYKDDPAATKTWKKKIITDAEYQALSSNIETLHTLNEGFAEDLARRLETYDPDVEGTQVLADVFLKISPYFKMYTVYVNNYDAATSLLSKMQTDKKYKKLLAFHDEAMQIHGCHQMSYYLIQPIQRIPRYVLLLREILKHTAKTHPDYDNLVEALCIVQTTAQYVNESVRQFERRNEIVAIQQRFGGKVKLLEPNRYFVKEGPLVKSERGSDKPMHFFLFNNLLVWSKQPEKKNKPYKLKGELTIDENFYFLDIPDDDAKENAIQISYRSSEGDKSFFLYGTTSTEKEQWLSVLRMVYQEQRIVHQPAGVKDARSKARSLYHDVELEKRTDASACNVCRTLLRNEKVVRNCMHCGKIACTNCSQSKVVLDILKGPEHVCDLCYPQIQNTKRYGGAIELNFRPPSYSHDPSASGTELSSYAGSSAATSPVDDDARKLLQQQQPSSPNVVGGHLAPPAKEKTAPRAPKPQHRQQQDQEQEEQSRPAALSVEARRQEDEKVNGDDAGNNNEDDDDDDEGPPGLVPVPAGSAPATEQRREVLDNESPPPTPVVQFSHKPVSDSDDAAGRDDDEDEEDDAEQQDDGDDSDDHARVDSAEKDDFAELSARAVSIGGDLDEYNEDDAEDTKEPYREDLEDDRFIPANAGPDSSMYDAKKPDKKKRKADNDDDDDEESSSTSSSGEDESDEEEIQDPGPLAVLQRRCRVCMSGECVVS